MERAERLTEEELDLAVAAGKPKLRTAFAAGSDDLREFHAYQEAWVASWQLSPSQCKAYASVCRVEEYQVMRRIGYGSRDLFLHVRVKVCDPKAPRDCRSPRLPPSVAQAAAYILPLFLRWHRSLFMSRV